ncbi:peptide MFS transporter [Pseudomarimonas arenosa]|uniref:peptide MFS transporter n=1 Tax=Pseudomarimonas arenosa TaxID=2774145 RepID=UPI002FC29669
MSHATQLSNDDFLGHPKGLYVCFFTEMWERFSFYGMKALLFLYLTKYHLFGDDAGYEVIGAYGGLVYAIPVLGGLLADRYLGMRKAVIFGGILLVLGHLGMAVEGEQASSVNGVVQRDDAALLVFYTSLALIIAGVGFLKPNISTIVGRLYSEDDPRRDSGFSLFYAGINLGALFASLICGFLGETYGWKYGFGAAGIGMVLGLGMFLWGQRYLHGKAEAPDAAWLKAGGIPGLNREFSIYLAAVLAVPVIAGLMWAVGNGVGRLGEHWSPALALMSLMMTGVIIWFMQFTLSQCSKVERDRMIALMVLIFMALIFFTLYEQTYGSWVAFTDRLLNKELFPSFVIREGTPMPWSIASLLLAPLSFVIAAKLSDRNASSQAPKLVFTGIFALVLVLLVRDLLVLPQTAGSLTFLGAMFIVLLAPIFTVLWGWLDRYQLNPTKPTKSAIGLLFGGLAFIPLAMAAEQVGSTGQMASVWWLVLAYFILEIGEMCLSPVGLSAVTQLSVARVAGLMMGTWFLATAFSEVLAAQFGKLASIEIPEGEAINLVEAASKYADLFWLMTTIGIGCAVLAGLSIPLVRRMMHGVK